MRTTILVGLYGLCVAAVLIFYAVYAWLAPSSVVVIGLVALTLPTIAIVYGLEEEARLPKPSFMVWAQTGLVIALFGVAIPATWSVADARARALDSLGTLRSAEAALEDPAPQVRSSACKLLFSDRIQISAGQITDMLARRPEMAAECLEVSSDSPMAPAVTRQLTLSWHDDLLTGSQAQCSSAPALDSLPIAAKNRAALLLDCALRGTDETRPCCSAQLKASFAGERLRREIDEGRPLVIDLGTAGVLLALSFGEATLTKSIGKSTNGLGLETPSFQRLSLELACAAVAGDGARPEEIKYLEWLFRENEQCLETEGTTNVVAACEVLLDRGLEQRKDFGKAVCEANERAREQSAERASAFKTGVDFGDTAGQIDAGRESQSDDHMDPRGFEQLMKSGEFAKLSRQEQMALIQSFQRKGTPNDPRNPTGMNAAQMQARGMAVQTEEGRDAMKKRTNDALMNKDAADTEQVLGISMDELRGSLTEDGEANEEMQERIKKLREKHGIEDKKRRD